MDIPEYDLKLLTEISKYSKGIPKDILQKRFGKEVNVSIGFLLQAELIKEHTRNIKPFFPPQSDYVDPPVGNLLVTDEGRTEVKRALFKKTLSKKQIWLERFWGFATGVILSVLTWWLTSL